MILNSLRRNTHAKRRVIGAARAGGGGSAPGGGGSEGSDSDGEGEWSVKGTKAARKDARRKKLRARRDGHRHGAGANGEADDGGGRGAGSSEDGDESGQEEEGEDEEQEERLLREGVEALTLEGRLASLTAGGGGGSAAALVAVAAAAAAAPVCCGLVGEPNVGKSSTLNALLGSHRVAVSSHPGRTKHYQTHYLARRFMLCDCPGLVFPRLDVSLPMQVRPQRRPVFLGHARAQRSATRCLSHTRSPPNPVARKVLFGSFPIAHCRDPYSVVRYLAERIWPRLQDALRLEPRGAHSEAGPSGEAGAGGAVGGGAGEWAPLSLCEALCERHNWRTRQGGRRDTYRAANWLLRGALAGREGLVLAFLPPVPRAGTDSGGAVQQ